MKPQPIWDVAPKPDGPEKKSLYGLRWEIGVPDYQIERTMIQKGGQWRSPAGKTVGNGLFFHYRRLMNLIWPEEDDHRWSDLILQTILDNTVTALLGPANSAKTHSMAKYGLTDYFCFPDNTLIIVSSTTLSSLEYRVWGDIKGLFNRAKEKFPELPGVVIDNKHAICTDDLDNEKVKARDMRKGIICLPCKTSTGGKTNIAGYVGMKQERRRYLADELQFMEMAMFDSLANVNTGDFKMVGSGNPIGEDDPLDRLSEPKIGWEGLGEITKTTVWENKLFLNSKTVNLVGIDSPNFPQWGQKPRYPYLVNQDNIDRVVAGTPAGKDSWQYWSQCMGVRRAGLGAKRVLTQTICDTGKAFAEIVWDGARELTKIAALDAAYGGTGGDRCVLQLIEFGQDVNGKMILVGAEPIMVPVKISATTTPEDQIAHFCKNQCEQRGIKPENFFYDSTGRGSLGVPLARLWSDKVNAVEFGGKPSDMPVSLDLYVYDPEKRVRRLQTCAEHYSKKVTEIWYSVRYAVEAQQIRKLPRSVAEELYKREWTIVAGNKVEVEAKAEMKLRTGRSPDLGDAWCLAVHGARMRGFQISKLAAVDKVGINRDSDWLKKWRDDAVKIRTAHELIEV